MGAGNGGYSVTRTDSHLIPKDKEQLVITEKLVWLSVDIEADEDLSGL